MWNSRRMLVGGFQVTWDTLCNLEVWGINKGYDSSILDFAKMKSHFVKIVNED
jgi:hypothetical protein